jgi:hypothetical protein
MAALSWNPRAVRAFQALKDRTGHVRQLEVRQALSALAADTLPGETVIGRALRDLNVWPAAPRMVEGRLGGPPASPSGRSVAVDQLEFAVEEVARREGAIKVGERHLIQALLSIVGPDTNRIELDPARLINEVRLLELGTPFLPSEIQGRWHGLVDANVVAQGKEVRNVNWQKATGSSRVTVWATTVLLDELDRLAYDQRRSPSADRVRVFNRWLRPLLQDTLAPGGYALPGAADTRLRVWVAPVVLGPPDERHLGAAEELLERGVPIKVITGDNGMAARAMSRGLDTFDPTDDILLTPGQGAAASP